MELMTWNPLREMDALLNRSGFGAFRNMDGENWIPAVDIHETKKAYVIKAETPGVAKEDIKVSVENGVLTVEGERRKETEEKDEKHVRRERYYGHFARSFSLPEDAATDQVKAKTKDGVVEIRIPKAQAPASRKTEIKVD